VSVLVDVADRLGRNLRELRTARGFTQEHMARLSGLPRATWANLESGAANPTLQVLHRAALALQVSIEELIAMPKASARLYERGSLPARQRGPVEVRSLLPDPLPGMLIERIELPARTTLAGVPHTAGTREYLTCERGSIVLAASGERYELSTGDVVVFRGDQRHGYRNTAAGTTIAYSVIAFAPVGS